MSFLAWIVLGLVSGFIASKLVNKTGEGVIMDTFIYHALVRRRPA